MGHRPKRKKKGSSSKIFFWRLYGLGITLAKQVKYLYKSEENVRLRPKMYMDWKDL